MRLALLFALPSLLVAGSPLTKEMSLQTADGFTLKGTLTLPSAKGKHPVVILAHQFGSKGTDWAPLVEQLHQRGVATLAMDLRGHGQSTMKGGQSVSIVQNFMESSKIVGFDKIPEDLIQAAAWVRKQTGVNGHRLGLAGASVGGFSVIMASPKVRPIAVLSLSPAGTEVWGKDGRDQLVKAFQKGHAATFVYASDKDPDAHENAKALQGLSGICASLFPGMEHGMDYLKANADTMAVFFTEYLRSHRHGKPAEPKKAGSAAVIEPAKAMVAVNPAPTVEVKPASKVEAKPGPKPAPAKK